MTPATLSLVALVAVIVLSLTSRINIGVLAVALALPVGVGAAGWKPEAVPAAKAKVRPSQPAPLAAPGPEGRSSAT